MTFVELLPLVTLILLGGLHRYTFSSLFEKYFRLTLVDAPVYSLIFFAAWAIVFGSVFPRETSKLFEDVTIIGYLVLIAVFFVAFPAIYRFLRREHGKETPWLSKLYPKEGMLSLEERYIMAKVGDVFVQQLIAGIMVTILVSLNFSYPWVVGIFVSVFGAAHLYLLRTSGILWGLYYTFFGVMGAFAIPFFIFYIEAGIWYTLIFHLFLYVLFAAFFAYFPKPSRSVLKDVMSHEDAE